MEKVIKIAEIGSMSQFLNTREAASKLFGTLDFTPYQVVEFDFSSVEFMSRSFADQFIKEKVQLMKVNSHLFIRLSNMEANILAMLQAVERTQRNTNRSFSELPVYSFSDSESLSDYLLSI
jgi:hypothetical protein